jgi:hypothetical protein
MPATSKLSILQKRRTPVIIILLALSALIFATPYVWPKLIAGPAARDSASTTTIAIGELDNSLVGGLFVAEPNYTDPQLRKQATKEQVLSIDIHYPQSMRLNETPTVDLSLSAEEESYNSTLFIKLSSAGFKIDPETPLEVNGKALPMRQSWTISPSSEGKHTLVLSFSKPTAVGLAKLNDTPVQPEETFKLPITVYTIYGIPLWMVNTLGALAALGGTAVAWGPFAAWLYERKSPARQRARKSRQLRRGKQTN